MPSSQEEKAEPQKRRRPLTIEPLNEKYQMAQCKSTPDMAAIETFVVNAFSSQEPSAKDRSHAEAYKAMLRALKAPNDLLMIRKVLHALRTAGHGEILSKLALQDQHAQLLHLVIKFVSTTNSEVQQDLCDAHFNLLLAIVSAKSTHVVPVLNAAWKLLTQQGIMLDNGIVHRIHSLIFNVLRLVPKAKGDIYPIIASKFPFWLREKEALVWYTTQSFTVLEYLPSIRPKLFELLIDKCVEIDVNIFIKDNGDVAIVEDKQPDETPIPDAANSVDVLSDKLDALLEMLFSKIQSDCHMGVSSTQQIYRELVQIFETTILTTHKSKFVQFCVFLPCGLEAQVIHDTPQNDSGSSPVTVLPGDTEAILYREFVSKLLQILVDPYKATMTRQSCACYLASFVSRASFVGVDTVCESVSALLRWAEAYINSLGAHGIFATDARQQSEQHPLFYTVCQAAFYIMSFRGNEAIEFYQKALLSKENETSQNAFLEDASVYPDVELLNLDGKRWTSLCGHALQPLRFCLESVRSEFLHVAHFYNLLEEDVLNKLVEDAKRLSTGRVNKKAASSISTAATLEHRRQKGGVGGLGRGSNPLKSFFPFDPLLLRQSHQYIEPLYKYWQGPVEEEDVLQMDEVQGDGDPTFVMDDGEHSLDESEESDDEDDDSDDESDSDSDREEYDRSPSEMLTPDAYKIKMLQQKAWTETLKRPRSQSMEHGSW